jgi:hypothetical protein
MKGCAVVLAGVYIGSFLHLPRRRTPVSIPECLPLEERRAAG